jgi:hypothetical protein
MAFLSEMKQFGIDGMQPTVNNTYATKSNYLQDNNRKKASQGKQVYDSIEDHSSLIKRRKMVKGKITKEEYQELRKAIV